MPLRKLYHTDGHRQHRNLVQRLQRHLTDHQRRHLLPGYHTTQRQREEDDRVHPLAEDGAQHRTGREVPTPRRQLHTRHHIGIGERTRNKCDERCQRNARSQAEDDVEALIPVPVRRPRNPVRYGTHDDEEEVHGETHPYQHTRTLIAPHLAHHIIDDVADGEYDDTRCQVDRSKRELLCLQYVCRNQADAEQRAEKHKQHTDFPFVFLFHNHSCFVKGGPPTIGFRKYPYSREQSNVFELPRPLVLMDPIQKYPYSREQSNVFELPRPLVLMDPIHKYPCHLRVQR